ncbi:MAG: UBP-type zinc finger domain-containing protein [Bacteroidota bacterium]
MNESCPHLDHFQPKYFTKDHVCEECIKTHSRWVHLRTCQTCGITLCCDSSPNKHATKHYEETGHPVVISAEPDEYWAWCYEHQALKEYKK